MTMHTERHPLSGTAVKVIFAGEGHFQIPDSKGKEVEFVVEDWWDHLTQKSWMISDGNFACAIYAMRAGIEGLPVDDEVIYGKVGAFGHLVHASELVAA